MIPPMKTIFTSTLIVMMFVFGPSVFAQNERTDNNYDDLYYTPEDDEVNDPVDSRTDDPARTEVYDGVQKSGV